jgi:asparagine synthase (glutamine-hydrolysing)
VAQRFGTEHLELEVRANAAELAGSLVRMAGQPFADSSMIPTYLIAEAAREHVTVVLTGDGGDETFGGYERFAAAIAASRVPSSVHRALGAAARVLPGTGSYFEMRSRVRRFSADPTHTPEQRYRGWVSVFDPPAARSVLSPELHPELEGVYDSFDREIAAAGDVPLLHRLMAANLRTYLLDDLLVKTDRMTMASSLEARSPLLDTALLSYVASLPPSMKASAVAPKRLLRKVAARMLPRGIVSRRKHGFGVPVGRWFRSDLREMFQDLVLSPNGRANEALDPSGVHALYRAHQEGTVDHGPKLWALLSLELWLRSLEDPAAG